MKHFNACSLCSVARKDPPPPPSTSPCTPHTSTRSHTRHFSSIPLPSLLQYISGLKWMGGRLVTASYDGSLRMLDPSRGIFQLAWGDEEREYSCMDVTPDGSTALLGDNEGAADFIDLRLGKRVQVREGGVWGGDRVGCAGRAGGQPGDRVPAPAGIHTPPLMLPFPQALDLHTKKINTISLDPTPGSTLFISASTDTRISLWDLRKLGAGAPALATSGHSKSVQSAVYAPDASGRVASTSLDDTVQLWDAKQGLAPIRSIPHNNNTGRWVSASLPSPCQPASACLMPGGVSRHPAPL
jgi:WD40 repeat protein